MQRDVPQTEAMSEAVALYCPRCGYNLTGLPENRCPECGEGFDPETLRAEQVLPIGWRELIFEMLMLASPLIGSIAFMAVGATSGSPPVLTSFLLTGAGLFLLQSIWVVFCVPFICMRLAKRLTFSRARRNGEERSGLKKVGFIWLYAVSLWLIQIAATGLVWIALMAVACSIAYTSLTQSLAACLDGVSAFH